MANVSQPKSPGHLDKPPFERLPDEIIEQYEPLPAPRSHV